MVVSAGYGIIGRWRESYDELDYERADELLTELGAQQLADRTFGTLSEGERKRVQIARALMTDPELLLLDEPAAGLDLGGREDLVSTLSLLASARSSPATVLVSHHVEEIPPNFSHAMLLRDGQVVAVRSDGRGDHRGQPHRDVPDASGAQPRGGPVRRPAAVATPPRLRRLRSPRSRWSRRIGLSRGLAERQPLGGVARTRHRPRRRRAGQPRPGPADAGGRRVRRRHQRGGRAALRPADPARRRCVRRDAGAGPAQRRQAAALRPRAPARPRQAGRPPGAGHRGRHQPHPWTRQAGRRDLVGRALRRQP